MRAPARAPCRYEFETTPLIRAEVDGVRILGRENPWATPSPAHPMGLPSPSQVRILTPERAELLQRVPEVSDQIFSPGAVGPAARLLETSMAFDDGLARVDDLLNSLSGEMAAAVTTCIEAARHEVKVEEQGVLVQGIHPTEIDGDISQEEDRVRSHG